MVQDQTTDRIRPRRIEEEMERSYLDYAMSVIVSRALPDIRDGLKPVQRRILFGMQELGVGPNSAFKKTARTVGEVMGKFHPHGDTAIYDTLVRMGQDFTLRYPLITPQGNFGSIDGDPPAQMRYTEARLAPIAMELLNDLDRNTVDFQPNFDDSMQEPVVLPARIPNLLLNGASGIAVGMATNIPPHNLNELCDAITATLAGWEVGAEHSQTTVEDLLEIVKGPDFPTGAAIFNREEIRQAYRTGRGRVLMQATMTLEETRANRYAIIVSELPYQVNKATLIERIAELVRGKRIEGISDLRDESDRDEKVRILIELSRGASYQTVRNQLFKHTALQSTFAVNMLALVDGRPEVVNLRDAIEAFIRHRRVVIRRRSEFDLEKARDRAHILEGLLKAIEQLDLVIRIIRGSASADAAKTALMSPDPHMVGAVPVILELSDRQAQAVLDMQLRRLAALERQRIEDEHADLAQQIAALEDLLAHPEQIDAVIGADCAELKTKYGDARRTQVFDQAVGEISEEDLIPHQRIIVTISDRGYVKRLPLETYRTQGRGGRGITGMATREEDAVRHLIVCDTHDALLLFTLRGRVHSARAFELPEASRTARGTPLVNFVDVDPEDRVTAVVAVEAFDRNSMVLATAQGEVKRTPMAQFESVRRSGLIAMDLPPGDELIAAHAARDTDDVMLVSSDGQAIRFAVDVLRVASRASGGVRGMRLQGDAHVIGLVVAADGEDVLVVSERGIGKRTAIAEYPAKGRGGQGVLTFRVTPRSGPLAVARVLSPQQDLILISREGIVMRTRVEQISRQGRSTQGVSIMNMDAQDTVAAIAQIDIEPGDAAEPAADSPAV